jgi:hypothetical protein
MPEWCRSRYAFFLGLGFFAVAFIEAEGLLRQRPVARIGTEVLLFAALLAYQAWLYGWRRFLRETLPISVISGAAIVAQTRFGGLFEGIGGSLLLLLAVAAALLLWSLLLRLIGVGGDDGEQTAPSWAEEWAKVRAKRPSRAQIRELSRVPRIKTVSVKAPELAGVVEYDTMRVSGIRVEECAADWVQQLSEAKTDDDGRFALPSAESSAPVHWVRVSWPKVAEPAHLEVELSPDAQPLLVRLKPRKPTAYLAR